MQNIKKSRSLVTLCLAALTALPIALACGFSQEASAGEKGAAKAASKVEKDEFIVELKAPASCKAGSECKAEVSIKAKGEFHVNDKYPTKFKAPATPPEGVTFTKALVPKEDGKFAEREGTLPVGFTVAKAGKQAVGGVVSVGVCRAEQCVMDKVELAVDVDVK